MSCELGLGRGAMKVPHGCINIADAKYLTICLQGKMSKILLIRLNPSLSQHQAIPLKSASKILLLLLPFAVPYNIIKSMKLQRTPFKDYPPFVSCKSIYSCMLSKTRSCFDSHLK